MISVGHMRNGSRKKACALRVVNCTLKAIFARVSRDDEVKLLRHFKRVVLSLNSKKVCHGIH